MNHEGGGGAQEGSSLKVRAGSLDLRGDDQCGVRAHERGLGCVRARFWLR